MEDKNQKIMHTNFGGYTFVDANALLREPKVKRLLERLSEANKSMRQRPGVTFLKLRKQDG
jgi:hypothetical protein